MTRSDEALALAARILSGELDGLPQSVYMPMVDKMGSLVCLSREEMTQSLCLYAAILQDEGK